MREWSSRFASGAHVKVHDNGVVTHGALEPVMTVLEVRGFELRNMFLIGFNENCGSILVETQERANAIKNALEPAYQVNVSYVTREECWEAKYNRRHINGAVSSWLVTDITLKDGTAVMRDGRWVR
ncbi:hypothetical protein ACFW2V_12355 [Streptomyces sp. NPDC058947]|uniref:hypothetical protein n=1 Tax=Streptomyces sp. NPDC058947 TaxID=3346675 RepID=UPI0036A94480